MDEEETEVTLELSDEESGELDVAADDTARLLIEVRACREGMTQETGGD